jgi:hypothetical protein
MTTFLKKTTKSDIKPENAIEKQYFRDYQACGSPTP